MGYPHKSHPRETPVLSKHFGDPDAISLDGWRKRGGYKALEQALNMEPSAIVDIVKASGLRGRGGAGFPTGVKWSFMRPGDGKPHYLCCNADESEPGTFKDREIMRWTPHALVEGCAVGAYAIGAETAYIYIRGEFTEPIQRMEAALKEAYAAGILGKNAMGSGKRVDVYVHKGAGAYICGEETALLESLEGRRGIVRAKPPLPAIEGLWGKPTVINNVLSLAALPSVLADGAAAYSALGIGRSRGTQVVQLAGNVARGGIVEVPFGVTVREVIERWGGGTASGRPVRTVQAGGPLGAYLSPEQLDLPIDYEAFNAAGALLGHGSLVVFDDTVDMAAMARFAMEFCAAESCGKCTPCRIGSTRGVELIDKIRAGHDRATNIDTLLDLCDVMADASLCAMGGFTPYPVRSALTHFTDDFHRSAPHPEGAPA